MRREYSIAGAAALLLAALVFAECPPGVVEAARRVAALRPSAAVLSPPCRLLDQAALRAELDHKLRRDLPVAPELYVEALVRIGLVEGEPAAVYSRVLDFYSGQVLGFYEPAGDELVLVRHGGGAGPPELVVAHELAHAAQERRFRLGSRLLAMRSDSDQQRAASAVAEGEALLVMLLASGSGQEAGADALAGAEGLVAAGREAVATPPGVPAFFVEEMIFPYSAGLAAVLRTYRSGGWAAVDRLLDQPPGSTSELLHSGRPRPSPRLGDADLPPLPEGYERVLTDSLGEWALGFWLSRALDRGAAETLAESWDGDRLLLARNRHAPGAWALAWLVRCRDVAARGRLQAALATHLPALLGRLSGTAGPPLLTWVSSGRSLELRAAWPEPRPPRTAARPS